MGQYIKPEKAKIRSAIEKYLNAKPTGLDVTAYVLDAIGEQNMRTDSRATKRSLEQSKQEMGKMISEEFLPEMYDWVKKLKPVKVDPLAFPGLVGWVKNYTQHLVGKRRRP